GQRLSLHFLHYASPVDFHCSFTGPEFRWNLLVEHPRDDQTHDFMLAGAQRAIALPQFSELLLLFADFSVMPERAMNHIKQVLFPEWLREKLDGTRLHGFHGHRNVCVAGDEYDGNPSSRPAQFLLKIQAAGVGKSYVQNQAAGTVSPLARQEPLRR